MNYTTLKINYIYTKYTQVYKTELLDKDTLTNDVKLYGLARTFDEKGGYRKLKGKEVNVKIVALFNYMMKY